MTEPERVKVPFVVSLLGAWGWRIVAGTAALAIGYFALVQLYVVVVPVVLALFLASTLEPLVARLRRRGVPSALAATLVFVGALALLVGVFAWIGSSVANQFNDVGQQVDDATVEIQDWLEDGPLNLTTERIQELRDGIGDTLSSGGGGDGGGVAAGALQKYLVATALTGLIDAVLIGVALAVLGVPLVLPLAVLTFIGGFFPIIGATLAGLVAALVALVDGGVTSALLVVAVTIGVQQIEGNVLQPFILERAVKLHALVTVWAVGAGLVIGGLLGAYLAVPLVALGVNVASFYRWRATGGHPPGQEEPEPDAE